MILGGAPLLAGLVFTLLALALRHRRGDAARADPRAATQLLIVWLGLAMRCAVLAVPAADTVTIRVEARRYA